MFGINQKQIISLKKKEMQVVIWKLKKLKEK
jgi:hypothetical protein